MANDGADSYVDWYNEYLFDTDFDLEEWKWLGPEREDEGEEIEEREEPEETPEQEETRRIEEAIETIAPHWLYPS